MPCPFRGRKGTEGLHFGPRCIVTGGQGACVPSGTERHFGLPVQSSCTRLVTLPIFLSSAKPKVRLCSHEHSALLICKLSVSLLLVTVDITVCCALLPWGAAVASMWVFISPRAVASDLGVLPYATLFSSVDLDFFSHKMDLHHVVIQTTLQL